MPTSVAAALPCWLVAVCALAGPLDPPAGPIAPTAKPLGEVEPRIAVNAANTPGDADSVFRISQRGSYYLTGNVTGASGKHGIEIASDGVTLDLNGFDVVGAAGSLDGISVTLSDARNISVSNGSIRSFGGDGIDVTTIFAPRLTSLLVRSNLGVGIRGSSGCVISHCSAIQNQGGGIITGNGSSVSDCSAVNNTGVGFNVGAGCTLLNCTALFTAGTGFSCAGGASLTNCSAWSNTNGFSLGVGTTASACTATENFGVGFIALDNCSILNCIARQNDTDGIQCRQANLVKGNLCSFNGFSGDGASIHATLRGNRIEDNVCSSADRGIDVDDCCNFISRNTCRGNATNWDVVTGNALLVVVATTAPAVLGNSGGTPVGSTDPNVNFSY